MGKSNKKGKVKKMNKNLIFSLVPNVFFFLALVYLIFSGLNTSKAVEVEFNSFLIFFESLEKIDVLKGIIDSFTFVIFEAIIPLAPFLFLLGLGFFLTFLFLEKIKPYFFVFQLILLVLILLYTRFSIIILTCFLGILISSLVLLKATEKEKRGFSFVKSLISKHLHLVVFLIAIGLFLNSYIKFESYKSTVLEANIKFAERVVPDVKNLENELKKSHIDLINKTCEGIKSGMIESYQKFPQDLRENCEQVHDSSIFVVNTVKQEVIAQINSWNITEEKIEIIPKLFPILEQSVKITPLILAVSFYLLARFENFFISLLFGFLGFFLKPKEKKQKEILKKA